MIDMKIPIGLKKISPQWYNLLKKSESWNDVEDTQERWGLKLSEYPCCIVGEAYNFKDVYAYGLSDVGQRCKMCRYYSDSLYFSTPISSSQDAQGDFATILKMFIKHFKEVHM